MSAGKWIGPGMVVGWHSFTPNEIRTPGVGDKADRIARRERREVLGDRPRVIRRRSK